MRRERGRWSGCRFVFAPMQYTVFLKFRRLALRHANGWMQLGVRAAVLHPSPFLSASVITGQRLESPLIRSRIARPRHCTGCVWSRPCLPGRGYTPPPRKRVSPFLPLGGVFNRARPICLTSHNFRKIFQVPQRVENPLAGVLRQSCQNPCGCLQGVGHQYPDSRRNPP